MQDLWLFYVNENKIDRRFMSDKEVVGNQFVEMNICLECNKQYRNLWFKRHVQLEHMPYQEYYDKHLKREGDGTCYCGCGTSTKWNNEYRKYNQYLNKSHKIKHFISLNPDHQSKAGGTREDPNYFSKLGKLGGPIGGVIGGRLVHKLYPKMASNNGKRNLRTYNESNPGHSKIRINKLHRFKKRNEGLCPFELKLFKHEFIQSLYYHGRLFKQDARFWDCKLAHRGGISLKMDFSIPEKKLRIEIDGQGHRKNKDEIVDQWLLKTHQWKTIRFKNEDIENNLEKVVLNIKSFL